MGLASDENLLKLVAYQSSRDFMLAHKAKFNDIYVRQLAHARAGIPIDSDAHKVTSGDSADRYQLSPELKEWLDSIWQEQIQSRFGFRNYEALRLALQDLKSA
jgi:hypothetical protein